MTSLDFKGLCPVIEQNGPLLDEHENLFTLPTTG